MDDAALVALVESAGAPPPIDVHSGPRGRRGGGRGREDRVESLQAEADAHATRGDALADAVERADEEITELRAELGVMAAERGAAVPSDAIDAAAGLHKRVTRLLQTRTSELDRARARGDALVAQVAAHRRGIDAHRTTRITQLRCLARMRSNMAHLMTETTAAGAAAAAASRDRGTTVAQLAELRERELANAAEHIAQVESLTTAVRLTHVAAAAAMAAATGQNNGSNAAATPSDGDGGAGEGEPGSGNLTEQQEAEARSTIVQFDEFIVELEAILRDLHCQTGQLQEVFAGLLRSGNLERLEDLVMCFAVEEAFRDDTFAYVQHCASEVAELEGRARVLAAERQRQRARATVDAAAARAAGVATAKRVELLAHTTEEVESAIHMLHDVATDGIQAMLAAYVAAGGENQCLVQFAVSSQRASEAVSSITAVRSAPLAVACDLHRTVLRQLLLELPAVGSASANTATVSTDVMLPGPKASEHTLDNERIRIAQSFQTGSGPPQRSVSSVVWSLIGDTEQLVAELCSAASATLV